MLVSVGQKCACVKIAGRASFASGVEFKTLFDELLQHGCTYFVLELTECALMDSTFLGVLAGFGLKVNEPQADNRARTIELYNPNPRIAELLESLGMLHLFKVSRGEVSLPEEIEPREHTPADPSHEEVKRTCLEAHQILMNVNPANATKFKDVAAFLAEDLKKLKANQG
jgi:anti-sigma B factor antagonist